MDKFTSVVTNIQFEIAQLELTLLTNLLCKI